MYSVAHTTFSDSLIFIWNGK